MKIPLIASHYSLAFFKVFTNDFLLNCASDRNSEGSLCSSTFFLDFWGMFSAQNSNIFVQENFVFTFKKSNLFFNFKSDNNILPDKYVGILSWKHAPKIQKKKLKNIRSPQNFDLMHTLWKYTYTSQVKPDYLPKSQVGDLNEPCQLIISIHMFDPQWHFWGWSDFALDFLPERCVIPSALLLVIPYHNSNSRVPIIVCYSHWLLCPRLWFSHLGFSTEVEN